MKDTDNNVNVGDTFIMKAKVLGYDGYCPVNGYRYKMQLLDRRNVPFSQAAIYICKPADLLDKAPTATASVFRPLKAGDIAKCIDVRNRKPACGIDGVNVRLDGEIVTVITNEVDRENGTVDIKFQCGTEATIDPVYLELLIPAADSVFRPFKAGDIAKCRETRKLKPTWISIGGEIVTVITNEGDRKDGTVDIKFPCGTEAIIDPVYLELLIPVEELRPYYVSHNTAENAFEICRTADGKALSRMCYFYKEGMHEGEESNCYAEMTEAEAEKAAKDECNRLNEEWSKRRQHSNK